MPQVEEKHTYANSLTDDYVSYFFHQSDFKLTSTGEKKRKAVVEADIVVVA